MLTGKSAVVTGSTSGIGLGIANALAKAGAKVMLNGFGDQSEIDAQRKRMARGFDVQVEYHAADMSKPEDIEQLISYATSSFGSVDIVINNA